MDPLSVKTIDDTTRSSIILYDRGLLFATICLVAVGLLMVASSSIVISERQFDHSFHYLFRQLLHFVLGILLALITLRYPMQKWQNISGLLLLVSLVLLVLVLIPGVGRCVNGSMRWLAIGPVNIQVAELVKLFFIVYLAGYLVRHHEAVQRSIISFIKPIFILSVILILLLKQPDFGTAVVMLLTTLGVMFLAGVRLWQFIAVLLSASTMLVFISLASPYRVARMTAFLNPWADQFDSGYQLIQSLIAFGRGGWFGTGLGESVQKLFYLPEAHTDFVFAVVAEELGLFGAGIVIGLFALLIWRAFAIGRRAVINQALFSGYVAYGIALWLALQVMINIGVSVGVLPTKGLTLPLISYGGSSVLANCIAIALLFRIDYESRRGTKRYGSEFTTHASH